MRAITIGVGSVNPTIGSFVSNTNKVTVQAKQMAAQKCTVGCFSEEVISGYSADDLRLWPGYAEQQFDYLCQFAEATATFDYPTVFCVGMDVLLREQVYNVAAIVCNGRILGFVPKEHLADYSIHYENRTLGRGYPGMDEVVNGIPCGDVIFKFPFGVLGTAVCEDIWAINGPVSRRAFAGAEIILVPNGSPFRIGVYERRLALVQDRAAESQVTLVYANQYGGNDALVYDGGGFVNQNGSFLLERRWYEGVADCHLDLDETLRLRMANVTWRRERDTFNLQLLKPRVFDFQNLGSEPDRTPTTSAGIRNVQLVVPGTRIQGMSTHGDTLDTLMEDLERAAVLALQDYFEKVGCWQRIGIALSGGADSALVAAFARLYAERQCEGDKQRIQDFLWLFSMPTKFNSVRTRNFAQNLADCFWATFQEVNIQHLLDQDLRVLRGMVLPDRLQELAEGALSHQNHQARIRSALMWSWSSAMNALLLQPGNMSERAVGYTAVIGDLNIGGFGLIANMPKTTVFGLLHHLADRHGWPILREICRQPASAELASDQEDERDLMPFEVLDSCYHLFAGNKMMPIDIYHVLMATDWSEYELDNEYVRAHLKAWIKRFCCLFLRNIFKWKMAPLGLHLSDVDLDRERALHLPVVQSLEWLRLDDLDAVP